MATTEASKGPSKEDRERGYSEGVFHLNGKPLPNYVCVHTPCKHATLDKADAQKHAGACKLRHLNPGG